VVIFIPTRKVARQYPNYITTSSIHILSKSLLAINLPFNTIQPEILTASLNYLEININAFDNIALLLNTLEITG
jgi:hypothetical protein